MPQSDASDHTGCGRATQVRLELANSLVAPRAARQVIEDLLAGHSVRFMDDALLMTSELVTNAVMHTGSKCTLCAQFDPALALLRVEVADTSQHVPEVPAHQAAGAIGGHGLRIVAAIARRWGVASTRAGKVMWFELGGRPAPVAH